MASLLLRRLSPAALAGPTRLLPPVGGLVDVEQRRWTGGRPWSARKERTRPRRQNAPKLKPFSTEEEFGTKLEENDPMRFLPIESMAPGGVPTAFHDPFFARFANIIMKGGKRNVARSLVEQTLEIIKREQVKKWLAAAKSERASMECDPRAVFKAAVRNASPLLQLRTVMRGGVEYQVPRDITPEMAEFKALQWFRDTCREKWTHVHKHFPDNLAGEVLDAYSQQGRVIAKKREVHRQAEANRAYAHYRPS